MSHRTTRPYTAAVHPAVLLAGAIITEMSPRLAEEAACGIDPELHTGPDAYTDEPDDQRAARVQVATEVCAECPVQSLCLSRTMRIRPDAGVWAGLDVGTIEWPRVLAGALLNGIGLDARREVA
ncbi:WhiB family transcriptional regulator [Sphaerisporangium aureirubrum]|uniref:WhiB family transcriptional regulator n=1 Tax=Sphaerisporangium aureirubrum TaxID=1544736 RepID=A0ABW1NFC1_9ACTN